ncbi:MAG: hypothetical protein LJE83_03105 [Gammaproteobacteria bacterium]|nr:hypothetical protein [Gammaproteobacteria bacterium]
MASRMTQDLPEKIIHQIEAICTQGCTHVNQLLQSARNGTEIEELSAYSQSEINQIINELEQIMSVYADKNCDP